MKLTKKEKIILEKYNAEKISENVYLLKETKITKKEENRWSIEDDVYNSPLEEVFEYLFYMVKLTDFFILFRYFNKESFGVDFSIIIKENKFVIKKVETSDLKGMCKSVVEGDKVAEYGIVDYIKENFG